MTARTETQAARKPRSRAGWKAAVFVVPVVLAAAGHPGLAALAAVAVAVVTVLALRARWTRYAAGGRIAAWRRRRYQGAASWAELRRRAFKSRDAIPICTVTRGRTR